MKKQVYIPELKRYIEAEANTIIIPELIVGKGIIKHQFDIRKRGEEYIGVLVTEIPKGSMFESIE